MARSMMALGWGLGLVALLGACSSEQGTVSGLVDIDDDAEVVFGGDTAPSTSDTVVDTAAEPTDDTVAEPDAVEDIVGMPDTLPSEDTVSPVDTSPVDTGPPSTLQVGCADGSREGFDDLDQYPVIAGCGGAWDVPGIFDMPASCGRAAGNDGDNAAGAGCTVTDLCAEGWGVCHGRAKVLQAAGGCEGALVGATGPVFFTTQMSSTGAFACATGAEATNDLFGCGNLGCDFTSNATVAELCAPLVMSSHDLCKGLRNDRGCGDWCNHLGKYPELPNAWSCGSSGSEEALNVTKSHPDQQGGVLCCRGD